MRFISLLICLAFIAPLSGSSNQPKSCVDHETAVHLEKYLQKAEAGLAGAAGEYDRWLALTDLVFRESEKGDEKLVRRHVSEVLSTSEKYRKDWNYGNAIHKANLALGRLALRGGDLSAAKRYLLEAGKTPGSPQLDSFGPNMLLACELLARGENATVLQYFELCRRFWEEHDHQLDDWAKQVNAGKAPDFGANLVY